MTTPAAEAQPVSLREYQAASLAATYRQNQAVMSAVLVREIIGIWQSVDPSAIKASWPAVQAALVQLIRQLYSRSVADGTQFYSNMRDIARVAGSAPVAVPEAPPEALVIGTLEKTGPGTMLHSIKTGQSVIDSQQLAGVRLSGAAMRLVLNGSRDAVTTLTQADSEALGWIRVTSGSPCYFCAMLASRGAVYKAEASADFSAHNHCSCEAAPVFHRQDVRSLVSEQLQDEWRKATKGKSGTDAMNAWRQYWANRDMPDL